MPGLPAPFTDREFLDKVKMDARITTPIAGLMQPPICDLRQSTPQSIATNTPAPLAWQVEVNGDPLGMHDPVTNPSRVTITSACGPGSVLALGGIQWTANNVGDRFCHIAKGGAVYRPGQRVQAVTVGGGTTVVLAFAIVPVIVGDFVELWGGHNVGANHTTDDAAFSVSCYFQVYKILST